MLVVGEAVMWVPLSLLPFFSVSFLLILLQAGIVISYLGSLALVKVIFIHE